MASGRRGDRQRTNVAARDCEINFHRYADAKVSVVEGGDVIGKLDGELCIGGYESGNNNHE